MALRTIGYEFCPHSQLSCFPYTTMITAMIRLLLYILAMKLMVCSRGILAVALIGRIIPSGTPPWKMEEHAYAMARFVLLESMGMTQDAEDGTMMGEKRHNLVKGPFILRCHIYLRGLT